MKIRIVTHEDEKIIVKHTIIKLGVNTFDTEGSKVPISLFKDKGDILAAKDANNPATIKVGSDGQVLVSDSNEEAGVKWQTIKFGTITLLNSESFTVPSGMVVTPGTESGTFRVAKSTDTENLYVTSENIFSGKQGVLYAINGIICIVRVTEGAIAIGDKLAVSATDGVAEAATGDHFAIAVTGKSAGQIGTVSCILVNTNVATLDVPGGGTGRQTLPSNNILVGNGVDPIKLISTKSGAFYATGDNTEPSFNTLPIAQGGTGATSENNARINFGFLNNAGAHNSIYRGISLGTSVSAAQYAAISAGTFEDMYIGDYWTINSVVWRIAAFNYFYNCGDTAFTSNHVTIVPDSSLASSAMNATNTTAGGYYGSGMRASGSGLATATTIINSAFGSGHVATHRQYLVNAVTNGKPSGASWYDTSVELMSEIMVYGCGIFKPISDGTTIVADHTISKSQLPLFALNPKLIISSRYHWWLRDVVSAARFAYVDSSGYADYCNASTSLGVRPAFSIIG